MSFVIVLHVREGIVLASDSRLTLNSQQQTAQGQTVTIAVPQSDSSYKTFLTDTSIGISTFGQADIGGIPVAGFIESFVNDVAIPKQLNVAQIAQEILVYFRVFQPCPGTQFYVAGYMISDAIAEQHVWSVDVSANQCTRLNKPGDSGISWGGEADILKRLIKPVAEINVQGQSPSNLPHYLIPWQYFTLQDAIDFAVFATRSTIDAIRFQPRTKTVGGPIDVLVIKPTESFWVQHKTLHVD
jgi:hypothetical protein